MSLIYVNTIQPQTGSTVNISGSLQISQSLIVADDITLSGKLTLGDANTDAIIVNSEFTSSLIPDLDGYFDLGTGAKNWGTIYAKTGSFNHLTGASGSTTPLVITSASISYLTGSSDIIVGASLVPHPTGANTPSQSMHNLGDVLYRWNGLYIGGISASGDIDSSGGTGSFAGGVDAMDATGSFGYISASGDISTSGGTLYGANVTTAPLGTVTTLNLIATAVSGTITTPAQSKITSLGVLSSLNTGPITCSSTITAGGIISSSAGFEADTASTSSFGFISASGNISSSAGLYARSLSIDTNGVNALKIDTLGNISASGFVAANQLTIASTGTNVAIISSGGQITSSGNISSSGNVVAYTGSFETLETSTTSTSSLAYITASGIINAAGLTVVGPWGMTANTNFVCSATAVMFTASVYNDLSVLGHVTASTLQVANNAQFGASTVTINSALGQISASRVSASAGFEADTASTSSYGYISASGDITSINATGSFGHVTASQMILVGSALPVGNGVTLARTGHISASGNVSASGFDTRKIAGTSADAVSYSVNGRKVEVLNQLQATLSDGAFSFFELRNTSIETDSIVLGSFTGNTIGAITGSMITAATIAQYTAAVQIHNEAGEAVADDTPYTASFIVL